MIEAYLSVGVQIHSIRVYQGCGMTKETSVVARVSHRVMCRSEVCNGAAPVS